MRRTILDDPRYYLNRHGQWLDFNRRVLEEAGDPGNPLLERVKFLAITANNLDEFVEVRVSSFLQRIEHGSAERSPDGLSTEEELALVTQVMHSLVRDQYKCLNGELLPQLAKESIRVLRFSELDAKAEKFAKNFYQRRVAPMLTPVTVDPSHPFPHVLNKALCISFLLRRRRGGNGKPYFGVVTVPRALPRLLRVPAEGNAIHYVALQEIVSAYAPKLYRGYEILASAPFRITRNSNLYLEEEEARSLLDAIDSQVAQRRKGWAVRLEIEAGAQPEIIERLVTTFELDEPLVFRVPGMVNLQRLFHGLVGLKTHAKLALVVREDPDGTIRRYAHLGTGNYNPSTARYYTDFSLLTCDEAITASVNDVFNFLTAYAEQPNYKPLLVAPRDLAKGCIALIDREARNAKRGRLARIIAKMNALVDPPVIQALYRASQAGVEIDLIVRGQCALVPGLRGVSSRIRVRSIVGRFLEHSRIFYFGNAGEPEIYLGSADWMQRNLYERVEVLFPLKDPQLRRRITEEILPAYLADTRAARLLGADGNFRRSRAGRNGRGISVQEQLMRAAQHSPSAFDTRMGKTRHKINGAVYTDSAGSAAPDDPTAESASQDSLNASV